MSQYLYALIPYKGKSALAPEDGCAFECNPIIPELRNIDSELADCGYIDRYEDFILINTCYRMSYLTHFDEDDTSFCREEIRKITLALDASEVWYVEEILIQMFDNIPGYTLKMFKKEYARSIIEYDFEKLKQGYVGSIIHDSYGKTKAEQAIHDAKIHRIFEDTARDLLDNVQLCHKMVKHSINFVHKKIFTMDEKLITVTGHGCIHVVPDVTRLEITLQSVHDTYEDAYAQAKQNTERLSKIMNEVKLDSSLPKTIRFDIDKKMQNEYDSHHNYIGEKFIGFAVDHRVKIDLAMDNVLLNKIVRKIGENLRQAEINIGYTVRDSRPSQLKMLERAVKDAKEKASIMAQAVGCSLGLVKEINYSVQELHIYSQARLIHGAAEAACCSPNSLDITPDDLAVSDDVTVVWYLSNNIAK